MPKTVITLKNPVILKASDRAGVKVLEFMGEAVSVVKQMNGGKPFLAVSIGDLRAIAVDNILGIYDGGEEDEPETPPEV